MPTADRKPRRRIHDRTEPTFANNNELYDAMRACRTPDDWAALRQPAIRFMAQRLKPDEAAKCFDAYQSRPILIPGPPPQQSVTA